MRIFGLIGRSLAHSFSQRYFTEKFVHLALPDCRYELFELADIAELPRLLAERPDLAGLNVTIPYKEQVVPYLVRVADSAAHVGAANVLEVLPDGGLVGYNTDYLGFRESLRRFYPGRGPALVLGTGGAARAVQVALEELGIGYQSVARTPQSNCLTYAEVTPALLARCPLLINATPLGTYPAVAGCPALPYAALTAGHYLFDLVYNPQETRFLQLGRAAGAHIRNGLEMLELQAEAAWDIWNGRVPGQ